MTQPTAPGIFEAFAKTAQEELIFLRTDFGSQPPRVVITALYCSVEFSCAKAIVKAIIERDEKPWITVQKAEGSGVGGVVRTSVDYLAAAMGIARPEVADVRTPGALTKWFQAAALVLRAAGSLLRGDDTLFDKVKPLMEADERRHNLEYFGSESGETD